MINDTNKVHKQKKKKWIPNISPRFPRKNKKKISCTQTFPTNQPNDIHLPGWEAAMFVLYCSLGFLQLPTRSYFTTPFKIVIWVPAPWLLSSVVFWKVEIQQQPVDVWFWGSFRVTTLVRKMTKIKKQDLAIPKWGGSPSLLGQVTLNFTWMGDEDPPKMDHPWQFNAILRGSALFWHGEKGDPWNHG